MAVVQRPSLRVRIRQQVSRWSLATEADRGARVKCAHVREEDRHEVEGYDKNRAGNSCSSRCYLRLIARSANRFAEFAFWGMK